MNKKTTLLHCMFLFFEGIRLISQMQTWKDFCFLFLGILWSTQQRPTHRCTEVTSELTRVVSMQRAFFSAKGYSQTRCPQILNVQLDTAQNFVMSLSSWWGKVPEPPYPANELFFAFNGPSHRKKTSLTGLWEWKSFWTLGGNCHSSCCCTS